MAWGSEAEEINSCQQEAQIPPALCSERPGREQGEQESRISSSAFQSGFMVQLASRDVRSACLTCCISYMDHGVGGESWNMTKIADGGCLTGRFTAVHDPPDSGVGLPLLHMLKCWPLLWMLKRMLCMKKQNSSAKQSAGGKRLFKGCLPRLCTTSAVFGG